MNQTTSVSAKAGFVACGIVVLTLAGCTTYVEESPPRTAYIPPSPSAVSMGPMTAEPALAGATVEVIRTESDFYQPLSPYGEWVVVGSYGRCWRPMRVQAGWRPYTNGHWKRTDAGWYWVSDEPWAWATYHYGRWDWSAQFGWIWVPQTQWAPAWVLWREGNGYIGWAPIPPWATIAVGGTVEVRETTFAPRAFVFVQERHLLESVRPAIVVVNNTTVINKTVNITKIRVVNKTVINEGPQPVVIERATGRRIDAVAARELRQREETQAIARHRSVPLNDEVRSAAPAPQTGSGMGTRTSPHQPPPAEGAVRQEEAPRLNSNARPEPKPALPRPEVKPEPKQAVLPREEPAEAVSQPQSPGAKNEVRRPVPQQAPARAARAPRDEKQPAARPEVERPGRGTAVKQSVEPTAAKAAGRRLKSPKEESVSRPQSRANAKEPERGRSREKPATPLPPQ